MSDNRRALLRRELLKEQLAKESQGNAHPTAEAEPSSGFDTDAALAGAAQGATFGFSDELGAGVDAAGDALSGNAGLNNIASKWREHQKAREAANKALEERSPGSYMTGEVGAGLASAVAMPSMGGAKLVGAAGEISPAIARFLAGKAGGVVAKLAGMGVASGIEAAPIGALYGTGASEHNLEHPGELAADAASGATMGLATGGALRLAGETSAAAMNGVKNIGDDSKILRQFKQAYNYGKKGIDLGSGTTQDELSLLPNTKASDFVNKVFEIDKKLGQQVGDSIAKAQADGVKINIDPQLQDVSQKMFNTFFVESPTLSQVLEPKTAKLLKVIAQKEAGDMNPTEAKALRDELFSLNDKLSGFSSDTAAFAKRYSNELAMSLDKSLKSTIPEYQAAAKQFESFRRLVPENIINKGTPSELNKGYMGNLKNPELKLYDASKDMLEHSQLPGTNSQKQQQTFQQLKKNLGELEKTNPEAIKGLGGNNAEEVSQGLRDTSDELGMIRQAQGQSPESGLHRLGTGQIFGFATTGAGQGLSIANKTGRAVNALNQSTPVKMGTALFNAGEDKIMKLAGVLKNDKATSIMGEALENAVNNKNEVARNAVLFKLMQNPDYRNLLRQEGLSEDENK